MFDEIFKRWVNTNQLTQDDIIPLFLEWNQTFGDGQARPEHVLGLMRVMQTDYYRIMLHILKMVGIKKGYEWSEIYDTKTGRFIARFWNKIPD
jgi:hypothetical protein